MKALFSCNMMILVGYDYKQIAIGILCVSLALLVLVIAYRKLLQYLGKGAINKQDFCVLHPLEDTPSAKEVTFYFTCDKPKPYALWVLNEAMEDELLIKEGEATPGGNIVRFDTTTLSNGKYFYCLRTENQKTMKKMIVLNA